MEISSKYFSLPSDCILTVPNSSQTPITDQLSHYYPIFCQSPVLFNCLHLWLLTIKILPFLCRFGLVSFPSSACSMLTQLFLKWPIYLISIGVMIAEQEIWTVNKETHSLEVRFKRAVPSIQIKLTIKSEEKYVFYQTLLAGEYFKQVGIQIFSDPEIVFDCLKCEDFYSVDFQSGNIKILSIIMAGHKKIQKELTINLNQLAMQENQMLRLMVKDLRRQIQELKQANNPVASSDEQNQEKNNQAHPAGDGAEQVQCANQ